MHRIFLLDADLSAGIITIRDEKAGYLSDVLRCDKGAVFIITDAEGNSYSAKIIGKTKKGLTVEIIARESFNTESSLHITLIQSLLKGGKMDLVVQKATELGIKEFIPVVTERSQVRETRKLQRWRKIAEEASRQSGRDRIPVIHEILDFEGLFATPGLVSGSGVVFWEKGGQPLSDVTAGLGGVARIMLFTGPEGGFSGKEIITASSHGFITASLGRRILRAETAAITAVSIIQYVLGDI